MTEKAREANVLNWLLAAASVVIIITGMRAAQPLIVPLLVAGFLAIICTPALDWLQEKGVPSVLALIFVILGVTLALVLLVGIAGSSIQDFIGRSDEFQKALITRSEEFREWLPYDEIEQWLIDKGWITEEEGDDFLSNFDYFGAVMAWFKGFLASMYGLLGNALLVLLTLIFMLAEASGMPRKLLAITNGRHQLMDEASRVRDAILHYMSLKTVVSLMTGALAGFLVWCLKVDYPVLWGLLAFLFNYVPNIGSFIAAIPPVLLALVTRDFQSALMMGIGYVAINGIIGNFVEPRMMGKSLGLSTLVVFLSLVFWGWVLGPVGMLLSVPLTMIVKIGLENFEQTRWMAVLLGSNPE